MFNVTKYQGAELTGQKCEPVLNYSPSDVGSFEGPWYDIDGMIERSELGPGELIEDGRGLSNITLVNLAGGGTYYRWNVICYCSNCPEPSYKVAPSDWVFKATW